MSTPLILVGQFKTVEKIKEPFLGNRKTSHWFVVYFLRFRLFLICTAVGYWSEPE